MSDAILMLRLEHGNFARVLGVLEDQLERLRSGAPVDGGLLTMAHEYLAGYPDQCHHPKEDLIYGALQRRDPAAAEGLSDLVAEHRELAERTEHLGREIREAAGDGERHRESLATSLREFLNLQRKHMRREEREFFPAALHSLTREDIAVLDFRLFDQKDRLFDDKKEARFERLRHEIGAVAAGPKRSRGHGTSRPSQDEIALLRELSNIEQFNRTMSARGLQLVAYRSGGYCLERDGQWVVDIPDCDEARAAWSAYYFVKGQADK